MLKIFACAICSLFVILPAQADNVATQTGVDHPYLLKTANPNANLDAKLLLHYLAQPHPIITGQFLGELPTYEAADADPYRTVPYAYHHDVEKLAKLSGNWVGLVGANYARETNCDGIPNPLIPPRPGVPTQNSPFMNCDGSVPDYHRANRYLIDHWNLGGLVTVMWQVQNPWTGDSANDLDMPGNPLPNRQVLPGSFADLYTPGTLMNSTYNKMLDDLAVGLDELQQAGVVVLFRPFHEQNGDWFWWGYKGDGAVPTQSEFVGLWQYTFNYLTDVKQLNNLLWVWAPNRDGGATNEDGSTNTNQNNVLVFNPGTDLFDIAGLDDYKDIPQANLPENIDLAYAQLKSLNKPMALAEYGPYGKWITQPNTNTFTWLDIANVAQKYPGFSYFMAWAGTPKVPQSIIQDENGPLMMNTYVNMKRLVTNLENLNWR